jgi:hypothetical protein
LEELPVLNPKSTTLSPLVPVQRPQEIDEKNSKKVFFWVFVPVQIPFFWTKKFLQNFGAAFVTWYYLRKKRKKT